MSTDGLLTRINTLPEVRIGTQIWMSKNYDFGGSYPNNSEANVTDYGRLYTWDEAMTINYPGWHLPTKNDFDLLIGYLGDNSNTGGYLKAVGTDYWLTPNTDATDSVNFNARGAGSNEINFMNSTFFWTSTEYDSATAWSIWLTYNTATAVNAYINKLWRVSVRLIKNS